VDVHVGKFLLPRLYDQAGNSMLQDTKQAKKIHRDSSRNAITAFNAGQAVDTSQSKYTKHFVAMLFRLQNQIDSMRC
jgi:hypothetical protein